MDIVLVGRGFLIRLHFVPPHVRAVACQTVGKRLGHKSPFPAGCRSRNVQHLRGEPRSVADKNLVASRRSTRRQEAQGKDGDTNVHSRVAAISCWTPGQV